MAERALFVQESRLIGYLESIDDGRPLCQSGFIELFEQRRRVGQQDLIATLGSQAREQQCLVAICAGEGRRKLITLGLCFGCRSPAVRRISALHDRSMEEAVASRRHQMQAHAVCAGRLSGDGDVVRIAAERSDVIADPDKCRPLIEEAVIARRRVLACKRRMAQVAKRTQSVVWRHDDGARQCRELLAVLRGEVRGCIDERTRMEPHDDWGAVMPAAGSASTHSTADSSRCPKAVPSPR